jgi:cytochrome c5
MKTKIMVASLLAAVALTVSACSQTVKDERVVSPGEKLYSMKCSFCHRPFPPDSRGPAEWDDILDEMAPKAGLTESERALIYRFLTGEEGATER